LLAVACIRCAIFVLAEEHLCWPKVTTGNFLTVKLILTREILFVTQNKMPPEPTVLDPVQLTRIEAVHRGFLYQHLFAVGCLLRAAHARASAVIVEADEDIEIAFEKQRLYVQVKTRNRPLIYSDVDDALDRFAKIRREHDKGRRPGSCEFKIVSNVAPGPELREQLKSGAWPRDVELCWPGNDSDAAILPPAFSDIRSSFGSCREIAATLPFGTLAPETLVWKLASIVMAAAAGTPPWSNHAFQTSELPSLFEQLALQLQDFPTPPPVYRPQASEPELVTDAALRIITGFSGAGKTAWVAQAAQHSDSELSYFDVGDLPGPAVAIPLAREVAGRYFGSGGALGQILLPGSTGLEMLRALALRLQSQNIRPTVVIDNAHKVPSDNLREIIRQTPGMRYLLLGQPGAVVQEMEAIAGLAAEPLRGWTTDTIAAEAADLGCTTTPASAERLLRLTAGLPLYVQNATRIAASEYAGDLARFCDDLKNQTHTVATAQELILSRVFNNLSRETRNAVAVLSLSDIALDRSEAVFLLNKSLGMEAASFAGLVRELRPAGVIEIFGGDRLKIHDAIRTLSRAHFASLDQGRRDAARIALKDMLFESITKKRSLDKFSLYMRTLGELGDIKTLVQFATDELFHELGVIQEIREILEKAAASADTPPDQRFSALDGLVFADLKNGDAKLAAERLGLMASLVTEHSLDEIDRLTVAMKEMTLASLVDDEATVLSKIEEIKKTIPDTPQHRRIFEYNAALAFHKLGHFDRAVDTTSSLIEEYYSELGLTLDDVMGNNPPEIFPLLKKGIDHTDNLKHLADTLDLHATALNRMGMESGLSRIHSMKFYSMANALDSLIRVGQDLADEFVARNDYIGARDVMERNVLPNIIAHKIVSRMVPVRAQYAVILAYCGEHDAAQAEMKRLAPYEAGLAPDAQAELRGQRGFIARLRVQSPPPQWQMPPPRRKMGRNERCYCGSGKKYKHCHGERA
jgi:hypothetical protein